MGEREIDQYGERERGREIDIEREEDRDKNEM